MKFVDRCRRIPAVYTCVDSVFVLVALLFALPASAQENLNTDPERYPIDPYEAPRPSLEALAVDEEIIIDGRLDEGAWSRAVPNSGDFIQIQPNPGYPMTERTVIRIMYDEDNLYIGAKLYDSEPD